MNSDPKNPVEELLEQFRSKLEALKPLQARRGELVARISAGSGQDLPPLFKQIGEVLQELEAGSEELSRLIDQMQDAMALQGQSK